MPISAHLELREIMCQRRTCKRCGKPDWRGCGAHIESVLSDVPKPKRCACRESAPDGFFAKLKWTLSR